MQKNILVTGGAGYIGTNIVQKLAEQNYHVVVVDNFSNSKKYHIDSLQELYPESIKVYCANLLKKEKIEEIFKAEKFTDVIHLAGKKYIPESFEKEKDYYDNNITATKNLLEIMTKFSVKSLIFPSSISVYGNSENEILSEEQNLSPICPYAEQKALSEQLISKWQKENNSKAIILRLSNPIGANNKFNLRDDPITTKYLNVLTYIINGALKNEQLVFNGNTHNTKDGTTIRDYICIEDVANAFLNALTYNKTKFEIINIGSGNPGYSVLDLLHQTEKLLNKKINYIFGKKRQGDISKLVTNNEKAKLLLNFKITKNLKDIIESLIK